MLTTPFLRRQMLEVVREHLLPWARARGVGKRLLLLRPPLQLPPDVPVSERILPAAQMRRGRPAPGRGSFTSYAMWPELGLHTIPFTWMGFLFAGEIDLRLGATRSLVCGPSGEGKIQIAALTAPAFFVIPPGVPHPDGSRVPWERPRHLLRHPVRLFWLHVSPAGLRCHIARIAHDVYQEDFFLLLDDEDLGLLARLLIGEMERPRRFDLVVEAALLSLLLRLEDVLSERDETQDAVPNDGAPAEFADITLNGRLQPPPSEAPALPNVTVEAALRFIEAHLNWRTLTPEAVAAHVYISASHLNRLFKAELGLTVKGHIQNSRIELAKSLLQNSDIPVAEVGFLSGFFPPSHFTRAFSQAAGCAPKTFRNANRKARWPDASPLPSPAPDAPAP